MGKLSHHHNIVRKTRTCIQTQNHSDTPTHARFGRRTDFPASNNLTRDIMIFAQLTNAVIRTDFRTTFPKLFPWSNFQERDFKFCFIWYPTDITACLWSEFIYPRIRTFVEKHFHGLFSKKKDLKSEGFVSGVCYWNEAEVNFFHRAKLSRRDYLDYLKNEAKSGDLAILDIRLEIYHRESCRKSFLLPALPKIRWV